MLPFGVHGQNVGTLTDYLYSSLEGSNRKFACPLEIVAVTCSVNGTSLRWEAQEGDNESVQIHSFGQSDSVGSGFSRPKQFSCHGWIIFTGALAINDTNPGMDSLSKSSMIVTPISRNVLSYCAPLIIICKSLDPEAEANTMIVTHQIAGECL